MDRKADVPCAVSKAFGITDQRLVFSAQQEPLIIDLECLELFTVEKIMKLSHACCCCPVLPMTTLI